MARGMGISIAYPFFITLHALTGCSIDYNSYNKMTEKYGMKTTAISELQKHFSEYLSYVKSGDETVVTEGRFNTFFIAQFDIFF